MIALWNKPPIVKDNLISNKEDIIWFWHTGMNNSPMVMFSIIMVAHLLMVILILQLMLLNTPDPLEHG